MYSAMCPLGRVVVGIVLVWSAAFSSPVVVSAAPATLRLGALFPLSGPRSFWDAGCWDAASQLAVDYVNNHSTILPHTTLERTVFDTRGERGVAAIGTMELMCKTANQNASCIPADVLLGPCFSVNAMMSQAIADTLNVTQVSPTASSPELSDKVLYPTFSRTRSPTQFEGQVLAEVIAAAGWSRISTFSSQHALDVATMDALTENLPLNVTIRSSNLYQKPHNSRPASSSNPILGLHDHLVDLKAAGSYVVVLSIRSFDIPVIFEALEDEGMFGDPWVYLVPTNVMQSFDFYTQFNPQYQGIVGLYHPEAVDSSPEYLEFLSAWNASKVNCSGHTEPTLNARRSFDAVVLVSRGFTKAIETAEAARGGGAIPTTQEFTDGVRSSKFVGVSGEVVLTDRGDRVPRLAIGYMPTGTTADGPLFPVKAGMYTPFSGLELDLSSIVWPGGSTQVPLGHPEPFTSNPFIQILGVVLSALGMLEATLFAGAALWLRKTKPMRSSSPLFMYLICFGGLCACVGVLMVSIAPITRHTCAAFLWVPTLARILILGCLFAKTHRIYKLFANKSLKRLVISDIDVLRRVLAILIPWMVFLATWQFINPFRTVEVETPPTARGERFTYLACGAEHSPMPWEIANAVGALLLYAWGAFLAFETRKVPADFNESRRIMLAIYNALVVGLVGAGLSFVLRDLPDAALLVLIVSELEPVMFTLAVLFIPKFFYIRQRKAHTDAMRKPVVADNNARVKLLLGRINKLRAQNAETMAELEEARVQLQRRRSQASRVGPSSMEVENPLLKAV